MFLQSYCVTNIAIKQGNLTVTELVSLNLSSKDIVFTLILFAYSLRKCWSAKIQSHIQLQLQQQIFKI